VNVMTKALVTLEAVSKRFGNIVALTDVSLDVYPGEIVCLLGDNGAGKSTLIRILSGYHGASSGRMLVNGVPTTLSSPRQARQLGIATVHQDVGTIPMMSVGRNFFVGAEPTRAIGPFRWLDIAKANTIAVEQMRMFGITRVSSGDQLVGTLSGGERQVLAIARAMYFGAKLLILDEPTSALGVKEAAKVLIMVKKAREQGVGIIFITHNARHAELVGDRFVVLAHGQVLARFGRNEKTQDEVLNLMAGGEAIEHLQAELSAFKDDMRA